MRQPVIPVRSARLGLSNGMALLPVDTDPGLDRAEMVPHPDNLDTPAMIDGALHHVPASERVPDLPKRAHELFDASQSYADPVSKLPVRKTLSFPAHSVLIDNYSSQWLFIPAARRWVQPFTAGVVIPLAETTALAEVRAEGPGSFAQIVDAQTYTWYVSHTWYAAMLAPNPGVQLACFPSQPRFSQQFATGAANAASVFPISAPAGQRARVYALTVAGSVAGRYQVLDNSGTAEFLFDGLLAANSPFTVPLPRGHYDQLGLGQTISFVNQSGGVANLSSCGLYDLLNQ